ncbi:outer dynein arm-docking complex subunit 3-like [Ciona intestinalis]
MYRSKKDRSKKGGGDPGAWTVQDRIEEVRGKLTLKQRDQAAYYTFSQNEIEENENLIRNLRAEIKEKRNLQMMSMNADEYVIREGFRKDRESQLAMQKYTVAKAKTEKYEHVFDKAAVLNSARHEKERKQRKVRELLFVLKDVKSLAKSSEEDRSSQRVRTLTTSLDKMKMKCSSAKYVQKTYNQILYHMERDSLTLPGRLSNVEQSLQSIQTELKSELVQIQNDAKTAYDQTKVEKEQLESKILKGKRSRDSNLAMTRRKFKKLNQESNEKETKPRKRITNKFSQGDSKMLTKDGKAFWEKVRTFWMTKRASNGQQVTGNRCAMCVSQPTNIAFCFERQIQRHEELQAMVKLSMERKAHLTEVLDGILESLDDKKRCHQNLLEDTAAKKAEFDKCVAESSKILRERSNRSDVVDRLLLDVSNSTEHIRHKVASTNWVKLIKTYIAMWGEMDLGLPPGTIFPKCVF